jgi:hypothetical protein
MTVASRGSTWGVLEVVRIGGLSARRAGRVAENGETDWQAVTARALAALCLHLTSAPEAGMADRGKFLMNLGLARKEAAALLGTSDDSLRHILNPPKRKAPAARARTAKSPRNA